MLNTMQVKDSGLSMIHQANIAASLAHRLEVAQANRNTKLVALLEQEQRQLSRGVSSVSSLPSLGNGLKRFWEGVLQRIERSSQLSVQQVWDEAGNAWWHAYDPRTGKTLYADSESEVIHWIEENHLGQ